MDERTRLAMQGIALFAYEMGNAGESIDFRDHFTGSEAGRIVASILNKVDGLTEAHLRGDPAIPVEIVERHVTDMIAARLSGGTE